MNGRATTPDGMDMALPTVPVTSGTQPEPAFAAMLFPVIATPSR
jgi:hypothetical protein